MTLSYCLLVGGGWFKAVSLAIKVSLREDLYDEGGIINIVRYLPSFAGLRAMVFVGGREGGVRFGPRAIHSKLAQRRR